MFIGEAPGANEDKRGKPFVGRAGELLTKGLLAVDLHRERDYYITNICKCRPENNRNPTEDEAYTCMPYLRNQVALIGPKIIVCLGDVSSRYIISPQLRITKDRGMWVEKKGIYIMPTFHPAAVLRDDSKKILFWRDLKEVRRKLNEFK